MPPVNLILFRDAHGRSPVLELLAEAPRDNRSVIEARIALLAEQGFELDRPYVEAVGDGLYAIRAKQYRIFYFFHERTAVVLCSGYRKKDRKLLPREIDKARNLRERFLSDPKAHSLHFRRGILP